MTIHPKDHTPMALLNLLKATVEIQRCLVTELQQNGHESLAHQLVDMLLEMAGWLCLLRGDSVTLPPELAASPADVEKRHAQLLAKAKLALGSLQELRQLLLSGGEEWWAHRFEMPALHDLKCLVNDLNSRSK